MSLSRQVAELENEVKRLRTQLEAAVTDAGLVQPFTDPTLVAAADLGEAIVGALEDHSRGLKTLEEVYEIAGVVVW